MQQLAHVTRVVHVTSSSVPTSMNLASRLETWTSSHVIGGRDTSPIAKVSQSLTSVRAEAALLLHPF